MHPVDRLEALNHIVGQAGRGELIFPTNLAASLNLQQALDDPGCHLEAAAELVLAEPLIAARLVAIGNSVAYTRFGGRVSNVRSAVSLLGFKTLRSLVAAIVVRQFAAAMSDASLLRKAELLWQHCAHVAVLAKVLAREFTDVDPETAVFAGIVHEISGFYLLYRAEEFPELLQGVADESSKEASRLLAHSVLQVLKVPKSVASAVEHLYSGASSHPPATLGDVLSLANDLASVQSPLAGLDVAGSLKSAEPIDFQVGDRTLQGVLAESEDEIESMLETLLA